MSTFTVGDRSFELSPLKVRDQLRSLTLVSAAILPIMSAYAGKRPDAEDRKSIADIVSGLERLPELQTMFAEHCKVSWDRGGNAGPAMVPLKDFQNEVFRRKPAMLLAWLTECVIIELGDFLDGSGQSHVMAMANRFESLTTSIGGSGESQSTPE